MPTQHKHHLLPHRQRWQLLAVQLLAVLLLAVLLRRRFASKERTTLKFARRLLLLRVMLLCWPLAGEEQAFIQLASRFRSPARLRRLRRLACLLLWLQALLLPRLLVLPRLLRWRRLA